MPWYPQPTSSPSYPLHPHSPMPIGQRMKKPLFDHAGPLAPSSTSAPAAAAASTPPSSTSPIAGPIPSTVVTIAAEVPTDRIVTANAIERKPIVPKGVGTRTGRQKKIQPPTSSTTSTSTILSEEHNPVNSTALSPTISTFSDATDSSAIIVPVDVLEPTLNSTSTSTLIHQPSTIQLLETHLPLSQPSLQQVVVTSSSDLNLAPVMSTNIHPVQSHLSRLSLPSRTPHEPETNPVLSRGSTPAAPLTRAGSVNERIRRFSLSENEGSDEEINPGEEEETNEVMEEDARLNTSTTPKQKKHQQHVDELLASGNYIIGCGGTIALPLQYEEVTITQEDGALTTMMKPKRGQGYSCHHCKTTKEPLALYFCSSMFTKGGKNVRKKCQKKYCENCLKRLYPYELHEPAGKYWQCPACHKQCLCASCERKVTGQAPPTKKKKCSNDSQDDTNSTATSVATTAIPIEVNEITPAFTSNAVSTTSTKLPPPPFHINQPLDSYQASRIAAANATATVSFSTAPPTTTTNKRNRVSTGRGGGRSGRGGGTRGGGHTGARMKLSRGRSNSIDTTTPIILPPPQLPNSTTNSTYFSPRSSDGRVYYEDGSGGSFTPVSAADPTATFAFHITDPSSQDSSPRSAPIDSAAAHTNRRMSQPVVGSGMSKPIIRRHYSNSVSENFRQNRARRLHEQPPSSHHYEQQSDGRFHHYSSAPSSRRSSFEYHPEMVGPPDPSYPSHDPNYQGEGDRDSGMESHEQMNERGQTQYRHYGPGNQLPRSTPSITRTVMSNPPNLSHLSVDELQSMNERLDQAMFQMRAYEGQTTSINGGGGNGMIGERQMSLNNTMSKDGPLANQLMSPDGGFMPRQASNFMMNDFDPLKSDQLPERGEVRQEPLQEILHIKQIHPNDDHMKEHQESQFHHQQQHEKNFVLQPSPLVMDTVSPSVLPSSEPSLSVPSTIVASPIVPSTSPLHMSISLHGPTHSSPPSNDHQTMYPHLLSLETPLPGSSLSVPPSTACYGHNLKMSHQRENSSNMCMSPLDHPILSPQQFDELLSPNHFPSGSPSFSLSHHLDSNRQRGGPYSGSGFGRNLPGSSPSYSKDIGGGVGITHPPELNVTFMTPMAPMNSAIQTTPNWPSHSNQLHPSPPMNPIQSQYGMSEHAITTQVPWGSDTNMSNNGMMIRLSSSNSDRMRMSPY